VKFSLQLTARFGKGILFGGALLILVSQSSSALSASADTITAPSAASAVQVEIMEGVPDKPNWKFSLPASTNTYPEPAFGFVVVPTKYSDKGIKIDRALPFVFQASAKIALPHGEQRLLLRSRNGARLLIDGIQMVSTPFPQVNSDGHEAVPPAPLAVTPGIRSLPPGHSEAVSKFISDGQPHHFQVQALIGTKGRRPELGELSLSFESRERIFTLLAPDPAKKILLTDTGWEPYETERRTHWKAEDSLRRRAKSVAETKYWEWRHELARQQMASQALSKSPAIEPVIVSNDIDRFIGARIEGARLRPGPLADDYSFLRRVSLDTIGTLPSPEQIDLFLRDQAGHRRAAAIDRLLNHPGWADHWTSYWQDVLAENPGILKPMLNNTGPFRWWIYESLADNKPLDRFCTELVMMDGSLYYGGPAGFSMATDNDVPMAQKAQVLAQAFLGMQMQCARCHDAPYHQFKQKDLFSLAAMLKRAPEQVPVSSSIPTNSNIIIGRIVNVTLQPGSKVEPAWPFADRVPDDLPPGVLRNPDDPRERLAALITDPRNERFAKVIVNRVWKRYLGQGLVEPVDDWETAKPSHPELLEFLARELVTHDYDLKHLARLILNSHTYQRAVGAEGNQENKPENRFFTSAARRRMTAEQLVDSLFAVAGKRFECEEMNLDIDGRRPVKDFINLGKPCRAWEFTSLSNERDRPALSMPKAQQIADTLTAFGWRESRQSPQTARDHSPNVLQPAALANGLMGNGRIARLSEESAITALCLENKTLPELVESIFWRVLSRPPTPGELKMFGTYLKEGFSERRLSGKEHSHAAPLRAARAVSWANHLSPEATRIKQEQERGARVGDLPAPQLAAQWRERMEDVLWTLLNSPEFIFLP